MPGRPEMPIPPDSPSAVRKFALRLRELRDAAGLTTAQVARAIPVHQSTLSRASSGRSVPSWFIVSRFADACQVDAEGRAELKLLWEQARAVLTKSEAEPETAGAGSGSNPAHTLLTYHRNFDRSAALRRLYEAAGQPAVRQLAAESGHPRSTVHRAVRGLSLAGAEDIAAALYSRLPKDVVAMDWVREVELLFSIRSNLVTPDPVPLFKVNRSDAALRAEDAIAEFRQALRRLRNLAVHGEVEINPQLAVQVLELQATLENAVATGTAVAAGTGQNPHVGDREEVQVPYLGPLPIPLPSGPRDIETPDRVAEPTSKRTATAPDPAEEKR
ncbi:helix-turn-helix domain-containing protein [Streptomyces sp. 900105245]